jgi:hypothetical protein
MIVDVSDVEVHISPTVGTPFTWSLIEDIDSHEANHGNTGETERRVYGKATPYVRAGDDTDEYSFDGLYNPGDATGQNAMRTAKDNKTEVTIAIVYDPTAAAEEGYYQTCKVLEYSDSGAADGDFVEASFTLRATGVRTPFTGGLPT